MGGKSGGVIGYKYLLGIDFALCHGPITAVHQINVGGREMWTGTQNGSGDIIVEDKLELFGGTDREGGVGASPEGGQYVGDVRADTILSGGDITFAFGESTQIADPYLEDQITGEVPSYRGIMRVILKQFYIGNNPYLKNFEFLFSRTPVGLSAGTALIGDDANPAHMIYELLTNTEWGMGYGGASVNFIGFDAVATVLHGEGFGLSMLWNDGVSIEDFIGDILTHINGSLGMNMLTGLFELKLIRDDYTIGSLPIFDNSNISELVSFSRRTWGETSNEVIVVYRDQTTNKDVPVKAQDLGNINIQGNVISQTRQYPGISKGDLANKVAVRDLRTLSSPLAKITMKINRDAWDLVPGDVFVLNWPNYGLVSVVMRVGYVNYGTLNDGHIKVDAIEDVFGLPSAVYSKPQPSGWTTPLKAPADISDKVIKEATLWDIVQQIGEDDATGLAVDNGYIIVVGAAPETNHYSFKLWQRVSASGLPFAQIGAGQFAPTALLDGADMIPALVSTFSYVGGNSMTFLPLGEYLEMDSEYMEVLFHDIINSQITVNRGVLDTVPLAHTSGARFYGSQSFKATGQTVFVTTESIDNKLLALSGLGTFPIATEVATVYTMLGRKDKPFPPGNLRVESEPAYQEFFMTTGDLDVNWNHRDRTQQTGTFVLQDEGSIGPEASTVYNLIIKDENGVTRVTQNGLSVLTYAWTTEEVDSGLGRLNNKITITLESSIGGRLSHTKHDYTAKRADWGYSYGESWGGI